MVIEGDIHHVNACCLITRIKTLAIPLKLPIARLLLRYPPFESDFWEPLQP